MPRQDHNKPSAHTSLPTYNEQHCGRDHQCLTSINNHAFSSDQLNKLPAYQSESKAQARQPKLHMNNP